MLNLLLAVAAAVVAAALTGAMRRYALARDLLDVPNARSSHEVPTPRGGGLAVVAVALTGTVVLWLLGTLDPRVFTAVAGGALAVAAVGYLDDRGHVPPRWRLLVHLGACAWTVVWFAPLPPLQLGALVVPLGWPGAALAVVAMVWLLNLYNFMDGIDGLAGVQALTVAVVLAALLWPAGAIGLAMIAVLLAAAALGFLWWNWPPARIFMGDAGSGFLGYAFAALVLVSYASGALVLWAGLIPLGAFVVDATVTLLRRWAAGARVTEAHRSHAYQHAAREFGTHLPVTLAFGAINLLWLAPFAWWAQRSPEFGWLALVLAWTPLVGLALRHRAGLPE